MYLHLGKGHMVSWQEVILIGQMGCIENSEDTSVYLEKLREKGEVIDVSQGDPQSFIITPERVYLSLISAGTLEKRLNKLNIPVLKED